MRFDDPTELERLLKEAVKHRVTEILGSEEKKSIWSRTILPTTYFRALTAFQKRISAVKLRKREAAEQQRWMLAKAVSVLALPGVVLYLILLSQLDLTQLVITTRVALSILLGG